MLGPVNFKDKARPEPLKTKKEENKLEKAAALGWWAVAISPKASADQLSLRERAGAAEGLFGGAPLVSPSQREGLLSEREDPDPRMPGKMEAAEGGGKNSPSRQMVLLIS